MNTDSHCALIDQYFDGLPAKQAGAALTEALESDYDALAYFCEAADMDACLQKLLAAPGRPAEEGVRITPFRHWRHAGKWIAAGAAAAALLTIAAVVLWPRGDPGSRVAGQRIEFFVKRLVPGESPAGPVNTPDAGEPVALEERVFFPQDVWLHELKSVMLSGDNGIVTPGKERLSDDSFLKQYLRAAGVTFPAGAGVEWIDVEEGGVVRSDKVAFRVFNTSANLERVSAIELDPLHCAPACGALDYRIWKFKPGEEMPEALAGEKVLTPAERLMPRPAAAATFSATMMPESAHYYASVEDVSGPRRLSAALRTLSKLRMHFSRAGDDLILYGLSATPLNGVNTGESMDDADMEFSLTLRDGQEAVLQLGRKEDGTDWVLGIQAHLVPFLAGKPIQNITLGVKPAVMQFDTAVVTAKAGAPVRLTYRNESCPLPHNFVLVKPGALDAIGKEADGMLRNEPEGRGRSYFPSGDDIVAAGSTLLTKGQSEVIYFRAPATPGDYPYLCTFPGHWRLQNGVLRVVP